MSALPSQLVEAVSAALSPLLQTVASMPTERWVHALAPGILALFIGLALLVHLRQQRGGAGRKVRVVAARARSMAAQGAGRAEIARRTGLSRDAVSILLHAPRRPGRRRILPDPARFSVRRTLGFAAASRTADS